MCSSAAARRVPLFLLCGGALVVLGCAFGGCGAGLQAQASCRAQRELACAASDLRVRPIGELELGVGAERDRMRVELYEASGCEREELYLCVDQPAPVCERAVARLPHPEQHAALVRALSLLHAVSRARCPAADVQVIQESVSLFRFRACDGEWTYHCRAQRCERLRPAQVW